MNDGSPMNDETSRTFRPDHLRCERLENPRGVGSERPAFSWRLAPEAGDERPAAYRVRVASSEALLGHGPDVWDSGWVGAASSRTRYGGRPLRSREELFWSVQLRSSSQGLGAPSEPARFEMGLLRRDDWRARWVGRPSLAHLAGSRAPYLLRRRFSLHERPTRARLYATALGLYELALNGTRVGDATLRPGWTDHRRRLQYQVLDVQATLHAGENEVTAMVAPGWYAGRIASRASSDSAAPVPVPELLVQLEIDTDSADSADSAGDDSRVVLGTDERWQWRPSAIVSSDLYDGEDWDLRLLGGSWWRAGGTESWEPVELTQGTGGVLVAERSEPVRASIAPVTIHWRSDGAALVDSGRNDTGFLRLVLDEEPGRRIEVDYSEILDLEGNLYRDNLRSARCAETFVCSGGEERLAPSFSFRGWRYAEVRGVSSPERLLRAESVSLRSDMTRTGWFSCSEPLLKDIYELMVCSLEANYVEVPTDCPQRDERMGWMVDALLFAPIAAYTYDIGPFMAKWLDDVLDARTPDGGFADIAPRPSARWPGRSFDAGAPAWADAGVLLPWLLYERYGDEEVLERTFPAMLEWLRLVHGKNPEGIWREGRGNDYGDWVPAGPDTSHELFSTCWLYRSSAVAAKVAETLGAERESSWLRSRAEAVRQAFLSHYVDQQTGRIGDEQPTGSHLASRRFAPILASETQTGYVMPLALGLIDGPLADQAGRRLAELVERAGRRLETGFCGSAFLPAVLERAGRADLAYDLLLRSEPPSLGFMAKMGATSVWERWNGLDADGWPACPTMNSFNHYAMSSMLSFLVEGVCGLRPTPDVPALGEIHFAPALSRRLQHASFELDAPAGRLGLHWEWTGADRVRASLRVPPGMRCTIASKVAVEGVPAGASEEGGGSGERLADGARVVAAGEHEVIWRLG